MRGRWRRHCQKRNQVGAEVALFVGGLLMGAGLFTNTSVDDRLGLMVAIGAATWFVVARCCVAEEVLERIRQGAYDDGYADGCEISRARTVRLVSAGRGRPLGRAAEQLAEECDVARDADRVG